MDAERRDTQRAAGRRKGPWSQAELEKLRRKYGKVPDGVLARELNRSVESVRRIAKKVFKGDPRTGPWAPSEIQGLKEYWGAADLAVIELVLRRDAKDILRKVDELRGSLASGEWTAEDIQALKRHYGTRTDEDLVVILGRPIREIDAKAAEYCLAKDKSFQRRKGNGERVRMPRWRPEDVEQLRAMYPDTPNLDIAKALDRTLKSVVSKAHDLGLKKSPDRLRDMGRENVALRYRRDGELEGHDPQDSSAGEAEA
ncbi:MAG: hypothetical protein CMJ94_16035 [Planctomycetes bacterium]|nr:hypothetical protein [Planctomycetota bacterium]